MPTVLHFTDIPAPLGHAWSVAARRAGVSMRTATDAAVEWTDARVDDDPIVGVVAEGSLASVRAARTASRLGLPWHAAEAVAVATHRLRARGRWLAAGLPVPWFAALPATGDDGLDRLAGLRLPCVIRPAGLTDRRGLHQVDSLDALWDARARLAALLARPDVARASTDAADTLIVESDIPGRTFAVEGVLERGALRVFAVLEVLEEASPTSLAVRCAVTPARETPTRQRVIAGHVARAALALGLHHGPVHAECRVDGDQVVVLDLAPTAIDPRRLEAIPVVSPEGEPVAVQDALLAHARGQVLDGYGHEATASGVLEVDVLRSGSLRRIEGLDVARRVPGVMHVAGVDEGTPVEPVCEGGQAVAHVLARGAQPDDVLGALAAARDRLAIDVAYGVEDGV